MNLHDYAQIKEVTNGGVAEYQLWFVVDNQGFQISAHNFETESEAVRWRQMFETALVKFLKRGSVPPKENTTSEPPQRPLLAYRCAFRWEGSDGMGWQSVDADSPSHAAEIFAFWAYHMNRGWESPFPWTNANAISVYPYSGSPFDAQHFKIEQGEMKKFVAIEIAS